MVFLTVRMIITIVFLFTSIALHAENLELTHILSDIEKKQLTPKVKQQAINMGKERALLCNQCHGVDGNSKKANVPNLAAQNPVYLVGQIEKFANGQRNNYVMNALSKNFTRDDKVNLALFYASMKVKKINVDFQLAEKGRPLYLRQCSACHGKQGVGSKGYARLAGQQIQYIVNTLRRFKENSVNKNVGKPTKRHNDIMESVARNLSDHDIKALAAYVAQLK